ncbi:hypothetical protein [Rhizohabitans arisaemae]|uniref:hypothetical protein n=1 Tax=Rhizohabitans arisaemae TaxID=2720610 RepID=UPI0024B0FAEF|nr:hypothetical protein [Rhizohabitans arisaemae]
MAIVSSSAAQIAMQTGSGEIDGRTAVPVSRVSLGGGTDIPGRVAGPVGDDGPWPKPVGWLGRCATQVVGLAKPGRRNHEVVRRHAAMAPDAADRLQVLVIARNIDISETGCDIAE